MQFHKFSSYFLTIFCIAAVNIQAQQLRYYDVFEKPCYNNAEAQFYSKITHTDSGWLRYDYYLSNNIPHIAALYKDSLCTIRNGFETVFYYNGIPKSYGSYIDNKKEATHLRYHRDGTLIDSGYYHEDKVASTRIRWFPNGFMSDSITRINDSTEVSLSWFDNGNISSAGYLINGKKHGKWKYFHSNGQLACNELIDHGQVVDLGYFNEDGSVQPDTSLGRREAQFKGGLKSWGMYLERHLDWPADLKNSNTTKITVLVYFTIDENGKITDAFINQPLHRSLAERSLKTITESPTWLPAIDHNRKIKAYRKQPLTFIQE